MHTRSSSPEVRNPLLEVPGVAAEIAALSPEALAAFERIARACSDHWRHKGHECWRRHKPPMAAYWMKNAVLARHLGLLCRRRVKALLGARPRFAA